MWWLLLLQSIGSRLTGFRSCSMWPQSLCPTSLVALWHVESSQTRDWACVLCIGRLILIFCTTREVPFLFLLSSFVSWDQSKISYGLTHHTTEIKQFSVLLLMPHESYCYHSDRKYSLPCVGTTVLSLCSAVLSGTLS